jgi:hypothetical protein
VRHPSARPRRARARNRTLRAATRCIPCGRISDGPSMQQQLFCFLRRDHMPDRRRGHACRRSPARALRPMRVRPPVIFARAVRNATAPARISLVSLALPLRPCRKVRPGRRGWRAWFSCGLYGTASVAGRPCHGLLRRRAGRKDFEGEAAARSCAAGGSELCAAVALGCSLALKAERRARGPRGGATCAKRLAGLGIFVSVVQAIANSVAFISALNA